MSRSAKKIAFQFERTIPAPPAEVFDAWLNPTVPGNPWNMADKYILHPMVDGFFYWAIKGIAHYGRFIEMGRPTRIQHTWVSPNTLGEESTVTVTFDKKGENTLMTLVHSDLPDTEGGRGHENGWNFILDGFTDQFAKAPDKKK
jgi:uncharacterized protein YndB with AHSA1/START domain